MSRVGVAIRVLVLTVGTFLLTEWLHYRFGSPPIFEVLVGWSRRADLANAGRGGDPDVVTESEFQTYVRVLEAMQADRSLSIESALATERIALGKFRELERRVQRNEGLIDRARQILRERAQSLWNTRGAPLEHG